MDTPAGTDVSPDADAEATSMRCDAVNDAAHDGSMQNAAAFVKVRSESCKTTHTF